MESVRVTRKRGSEVEKMRDACVKAATALSYAGLQVREGITTEEIDARVQDFIVSMNCYPSPLGYNGFPKSICTSVNEVFCHGIPDDRPLRKGDLLNIDVSVYTENGVHGDCSEMYLVGGYDESGPSACAVTEASMKLCTVTRGALEQAIAVCRDGTPYAAIGNVIEGFVERNSAFKVVPDFTGHGVGEHFHMLPFVVHVANSFPGLMREGEIFTIEPVVTEGDIDFKVLRDDWTCLSNDLGRHAQIEHTVLVTRKGAEVLTIPDMELLKKHSHS